MKYLTAITLFICSTWSNHLNHGSYSYTYNTDSSSRGEIRHPDGSVNGAYNFIDESDRTHFVRYASEPNQEIRVVSHDIKHNDQVVYYTQEHRQFKSILKNPPNYIAQVPNVESVEVNANELPPPYLRHVPSPVKHEPFVPIIEVPSPRRLQVLQDYSAKAPVVSPKSYYGEAAPQGQQIFKKSVPVVSQQVTIQKQQQQQQTVVRPPPLHTPQIPIAPSAPVFFPPSTPVFISQHRGRLLLAEDIPLTEEGLTPEVARARDQHFAAIAAVKATLPRR